MDPIALLQKNMDSFTKSEQKLAQYILDNPRYVLGENISGIAKSATSSNAALVRLCQKLGYKGFSEFKFSMHRYLLSHGAEHSGEQSENGSPMQATIEAYIHYIRQLPDFVDEAELRKAAQTIYARGTSRSGASTAPSNLPSSCLIVWAGWASSTRSPTIGSL